MGYNDSMNAQTLTRLVPLIVGDTVVFLLFAWLGRSSHAEAAGLDAAGETVATAAPFILGWFLVAPWFGAFRAKTLEQPGRILARTGLAWLVAGPVGLLLRALFLQRGIPPSFALVTLAVNAVLLLGWRGAFAGLLAWRRSRSAPA